MKLRVEWIYVFWSLDFPWRGKVGISTDVDSRKRQVQDSIRNVLQRNVDIHCVWKMPVIGARPFEKAIHIALNRLECRSMTGSGYTEWFWVLNPFSALLLSIWMWGDGCLSTKVIFLFILPLPIDFALFVALLACFQYAMAAAAIYGIYSFSTQFI